MLVSEVDLHRGLRAERLEDDVAPLAVFGFFRRQLARFFRRSNSTSSMAGRKLSLSQAANLLRAMARAARRRLGSSCARSACRKAGSGFYSYA